MSSDSESESGWTLESRSDFSDSDSSTDAEVDAPLPTTAVNRENEEKADTTAPEDVDVSPVQEPGNDSSSKIEGATLKQLLSTFLGRGPLGEATHLERPPLANTAQSVLGHSSLVTWTSTTDYPKSTFVIRLPDGLNNQLFSWSLQCRLVEDSTNPLLAMVVIGPTEPVRSRYEHFLASVCDQLLGDSMFEDEDELYDDLLLSIRGFNVEWRQTVLWSLLKTLLTAKSKTSKLLAICFLGGNLLSKDEFTALDNLKNFFDSTESRLKLLVVLPSQATQDIDGASSLEVNLEDSSIKEAILEDEESWLKSLLASRPLLRVVGSQILANLSYHYKDPLLLTAYLRFLGRRSWVTKRQLEADNELLFDEDAFFRSMLDQIPEAETSITSTLLSMVSSAARPLQLAEVASTVPLATLIDAGNVDSFEKIALLDIGFDLRRSLAGIIDDVPTDGKATFVCISHPSLLAIVDGKAIVPGPSWLEDVFESHMKMATLCLKYVAAWAERQGGRPLVAGDVSTEKWPFLDYAVRFWPWHYQRALSGKVKEDTTKPLVSDWELVTSWMTLWSHIQPLKMRQENLHKLEKLRPATIEATFKIGYLNAFQASHTATKVLSLMDDHEEMATLWAVWLLDPCNTPDVTLLARIPHPSGPSALLKVLALAPVKTLRLLEDNQAFIGDNCKAILSTAISQGATDIAIDCFSRLSLTEQEVVDLPWSSCVRYENVSLLRRLADKWPTAVALRNQLGPELLYQAVKIGNEKLVEMLLKLTFDIDSANNKGKGTALILASKLGFVKIVDRLLNKGANVILGEVRHQLTALHHASERGHIAIAKMLTQKGAPLTLRDSGLQTPLHIAIQEEHVAMIELLMDVRRTRLAKDGITAGRVDSDQESKAEQQEQEDVLNYKNDLGETPLDKAARSRSERILPLLLDCKPPPTSSDWIGGDILHIAASLGRLANVKWLLALDSININELAWGNRTALQLAATGGHAEVVQELMARGANIWTTDYWGDQPIDDAVASGNDEVVKLLLSPRPDASRLGKALYKAARSRHTSNVTLLLDAGADRTYVDPFESRTVLHAAVNNGRDDIVRILIMRRLELDVKDDAGNTALSDAVNGGRSDIARMLIEAGASLDIINAAGESLLQIAVRKDNADIVRILLDKGASLEANPSKDGEDFLERLVKDHKINALGAVLDYLGKSSDSRMDDLFYLALREEGSTIIGLLFTKGANPNATGRSKSFGSTLQECAYHGNLKMLKALLQLSGPKELHVNDQGGRYQTALIASVCKTQKSWLRAIRLQNNRKQFKRQRKMVKYLLEQGADPTINGGAYGNLLNAAAAHASIQLLRFVVESTNDKLPITAADMEGRTAAHFASTARYNAPQRLRYLIEERGGRLNARDKQGRQPLHFASGNGNVNAAAYFLDRRLGDLEFINAKDDDGWTPLHWACRYWNSEVVVDLLLRCGADVEAKTNDGWRPWHVALFHDNKELAGILKAEKFQGDEGVPTSPGIRQRATCDSCLLVSPPVPEVCELHKDCALDSNLYLSNSLADMGQSIQMRRLSRLRLLLEVL
ncbi:hypothetical protein EG329_006628 [Mollisiaceae sp. DMI_Dod_QoI]|nr:hypothetical protein EG329_006628 [Helotiales sp. DMI_Dod_QoI]